MGLIFTKGDLKEVSEEVAKYKVGYYLFYVIVHVADPILIGIKACWFSLFFLVML